MLGRIGLGWPFLSWASGVGTAGWGPMETDRVADRLLLSVRGCNQESPQDLMLVGHTPRGVAVLRSLRACISVVCPSALLCLAEASKPVTRHTRSEAMLQSQIYDAVLVRRRILARKASMLSRGGHSSEGRWVMSICKCLVRLGSARRLADQ